MSEDYIRPPIVALELPSQRAAIWRFRIIAGLVLLLLALAIVLIVHAIAAPLATAAERSDSRRLTCSPRCVADPSPAQIRARG